MLRIASLWVRSSGARHSTRGAVGGQGAQAGRSSIHQQGRGIAVAPGGGKSFYLWHIATMEPQPGWSARVADLVRDLIPLRVNAPTVYGSSDVGVELIL